MNVLLLDKQNCCKNVLMKNNIKLKRQKFLFLDFYGKIDIFEIAKLNSVEKIISLISH